VAVPLDVKPLCELAASHRLLIRSGYYVSVVLRAILNEEPYVEVLAWFAVFTRRGVAVTIYLMLAKSWQDLGTYSPAILSLVAILQMLVLIVAAFLTIRQLRDGVRERSLEGFLAISKELDEQETKDARRFIFSSDELNPDALSKEVADRIERVCLAFDHVGVLVAHRLIPKDVAMSMYFEVILRTWQKVRGFVEAERKKRDTRLYMMYFEELVQRADRYHRRRFPNENIYRFWRDNE